MAGKTLDTRIRNKIDTEANWTSNDPILLNGEIAIVKFQDGHINTKVGDGTRRYSQLPFSNDSMKIVDNSYGCNNDTTIMINGFDPTYPHVGPKMYVRDKLDSSGTGDFLEVSNYVSYTARSNTSSGDSVGNYVNLSPSQGYSIADPHIFTVFNGDGKHILGVNDSNYTSGALHLITDAITIKGDRYTKATTYDSPVSNPTNTPWKSAITYDHFIINNSTIESYFDTMPSKIQRTVYCNTATDAPVSYPGVAILYKDSSNYGFIEYRSSFGTLHQRVKNNGSWNSWVDVPGTMYLANSSYTDFDDIKIPGYWWINPNIVSNNRPINEYGTLQVVRAGTANIMQLFVAYNTGTTFVRTYSNNRWYNWYQLAFNSDVTTNASNISSLQSRMSTAESSITSLSTDMQWWNGTGLGRITDLESLQFPLNTYTTTNTISTTSLNTMYSSIGKTSAVKAKFSTTDVLCFIFYASANYGTILILQNRGAGKSIIRQYNLNNGTWTDDTDPSIIKVSYNSVSSLQASTPVALTVSSSEVVSGVTFGTETASSSYITLPTGTYRFSYQVNSNPGANGNVRAFISTSNTSSTPTTTPSGASNIHSGAGCGSNATILGLNATGVLKFTASTRVSLVVYSTTNTANVTGPGTNPYMTIERIV